MASSELDPAQRYGVPGGLPPETAANVVAALEMGYPSVAVGIAIGDLREAVRYSYERDVIITGLHEMVAILNSAKERRTE